ncbi:orotate phosphoribosyltransferase [Anoxybacterium hadale]|uniref:Orotate phosphoribosyltransferase n=1 Tax=Anoxybacterium hadale TaxID=3408580 RepID=A0ACD1A7B6_9FIRM|nr:orotate phosphoribosyltransferase [Clostridiales bacterium]
MNYKKEFIEFMVRSGVLTFGEFTTKSGRKSPYFINTGNYKTGRQLGMLGEFYAHCIGDHIEQGNLKKDITALFGPAYKGIPISVAASIALAQKHGIDINYCTNRKEVKDHGEGGSLMGYQLQPGDSVLIVEDVITAGTAMRECLPILNHYGVSVEGLIVSVDRMERGAGNATAIQELREEYGIATYPIITVLDILEHLHGKEIDGKIQIDDGTKEKIEAYLDTYCAK